MATTPPPPPPPPSNVPPPPSNVPVPSDGVPAPADRGTFRPRGIGDILGAAFELYRRHWQVFLAIVAIVVVPLTILRYFLTDEIFVTKTQVINGQLVNVPEVTTRSAGLGILALLVSLVFGVLISQVLTGAITRAAAGSLVGVTPDTGSAFSYGFARFGSILLVGILVGLAVAGGLILLIIPGIFLAVKFAVSIPALVVENKRGTKAMGRSWNLTDGHFWHTLGTTLVASIIAGLVAGLFAAPFVNSGWFLRSIGASIGAILTTPFSALVVVLLYVDLRVRKEVLSEDGLRNELNASAP